MAMYENSHTIQLNPMKHASIPKSNDRHIACVLYFIQWNFTNTHAAWSVQGNRFPPICQCLFQHGIHGNETETHVKLIPWNFNPIQRCCFTCSGSSSLSLFPAIHGLSYQYMFTILPKSTRFCVCRCLHLYGIVFLLGKIDGQPISWNQLYLQPYVSVTDQIQIQIKSMLCGVEITPQSENNYMSSSINLILCLFRQFHLSNRNLLAIDTALLTFIFDHNETKRYKHHDGTSIGSIVITLWYMIVPEQCPFGMP